MLSRVAVYFPKSLMISVTSSTSATSNGTTTAGDFQPRNGRPLLLRCCGFDCPRFRLRLPEFFISLLPLHRPNTLCAGLPPWRRDGREASTPVNITNKATMRTDTRDRGCIECGLTHSQRLGSRRLSLPRALIQRPSMASDLLHQYSRLTTLSPAKRGLSRWIVLKLSRKVSGQAPIRYGGRLCRRKMGSLSKR